MATADLFKVQQWLVENRSIEYVENSLKEMNLDLETVEVHVSEFKKAIRNKRVTNGFILMGIGAFLGFVGFVLTFLSAAPVIFYTALFGFTSVAAVLIGWGLYLVLE
jgi:hypothetical protein